MIQKISIAENYVSVDLSGSIYVEDAVQLRESMLVYISRGHMDFVVNVGAVDYIDSSGLGTLVAIQKRVLQNGGSVVIKDLQGLVKELFELTRLNKVFEIQ